MFDPEKSHTARETSPPLPKNEFYKLSQDLLNRFVPFLIVAGLIVLLFSTLRIIHVGWRLSNIINIILFSFVIILILLRRRIPFEWLIVLLTGFVTVNSVFNLISFGLASTAILGFVAALIFLTSALGHRAGMWLFTASLISLLALGTAVVSGLYTYQFDAGAYLVRATTWLTVISMYLLMGLAILYSISETRNYLGKTVDTLNRRWQDMQRINDQLTFEITERNRMEQRLRRSEATYRLLAENMTDVLFSQDMEYKITYISPSVEKVFGYSVSEMRTIDFARLVSSETLAQIQKDFEYHARRALEGETDVPLLEYEYIRKDGSTFWAELRNTFLRDETGRLTGVQGLLRDITERKAAEAENNELLEMLRHSEKLEAVGQLAGGVAHDFNNQLTGIQCFAELIHTEAPEGPLRDYAQNILDASGRSAELTRQLLAFSRRETVQKEILDLHAILHEVVRLLERSLEKNIRIRLDLSAGSSWVNGNATQLQNALLNIAINARDAMPEGGEIRIESRLEPAGSTESEENPESVRIELILSDTGQGMDKDTLNRIFEPFFTTKGRGTGLGLAAVYGIVKSHGGSISVESTPGLGSAFHIHLPIADEEIPKTGNAHTRSEIQAGSGHILVVEDEPAIRRMNQRLLDKLGYTVTFAATGPEAVEKFKTLWRKIDMVMLDIQLPGLSGWDVFNEMRKIDSGIKILICSGYASQDPRIQELLSRPDSTIGYLPKPYGIQELSEQVALLLSASGESE